MRNLRRNKSLKIILVMLVISLLVCIGGITYSFLNVNKVQEQSNVVNTLSCLSVTVEDEGTPLNLKDTYPVTDEYAINNAKTYNFKVRNECPVKVITDIHFESLTVDNQLNKDYVKIWFNSAELASPITGFLSLLEEKNPVIEGATSNYLTTTSIEPYESKDFALKMWMDYNVTAEQGMNKYFEGKLTFVVSAATTSENIYAVRRNIDSESSAWERYGKSLNLVANAQIGQTPVRNDFDNIYPWSAIDTYSLNLTTGEEISLKEVGVDNFPFDGSHGEILTRIPEFYYNRYQRTESDGNTYEYIMISPEAKEGYTKSEAFSVGRYTMSGNSTAVHSKSGVAPLASTTITNFRTYARALGEDFGQLDYRYFILQLLYLVEYADYNSQLKLGLGYTDSTNTASIASGECNTLGMKSGTINNDGKHSIIYRGIEDIFGNVWQFVDGINLKSYVTYVCYDSSQYAVDTYTGCYQPVGYTNLTETEKFVSKLGYDANNPLVAIPIASGGSASTYMTDYYWSESTANKIAIVGGSWNYASKNGLWSWSVCNVSSGSWKDVGARLLRYN